jgi:DNA-binding CsgD family transcriptional regulator
MWFHEGMKSIYVKELSQEEHSILCKGVQSSSGFTVRRCQILLSSAAGKSARQIASELHCSDQTVRNAIRAYEQEGLNCLQEKSHARHDEQSAFDEAGQERLREVIRLCPPPVWAREQCVDARVAGPNLLARGNKLAAGAGRQREVRAAPDGHKLAAGQAQAAEPRCAL